MNEVLLAAKNIRGAISMPELVALYLAIQNVPDGIAVDLGTHGGKAASVAAAALDPLGPRDFYCVDPLFDLGNNEAWAQTVQGSADRVPWAISADWNEQVIERVSKFAPHLDIHLVGNTSLSFLQQHTNIAYCFVDSDDHQEELVRAECEMLKDKLVPGGLLFFHDLGNQYRGPGLAYEWLVESHNFQPIELNWHEAKEWQVHEKDNDSWHNRDNPCPQFIGGLRKR